MLEERVDDAADGRERAEREHERADPGGRLAEPLDEHPHEPVERDLDHHAAHQRRDGAGAIGWARGSQACSGITPAFVPKPTIAASAIAAWTPDPSASADASPIAPSRGEQQQGDPDAGAAEVGDRDVHEDDAPRRLIGVRRRG